MDATTKDGVKVVLKRVRAMSSEVRIALYLSSPQMRADPRNRSVPILDIVYIPDEMDTVLIVMPYLRRFHEPPFHCRGEVIEALRQFLKVCILCHLQHITLTIQIKGLEFMHEHNISHGYD